MMVAFELNPEEEVRRNEIATGVVIFPNSHFDAQPELTPRIQCLSFDGGIVRRLRGPIDDETNCYAFCGLCLTAVVNG